MRALGLEPGTWADWANAAATALGFTIALVLFVIGLRDRRRADEERRRADIDRQSEQARKVWVWRTESTSEQIQQQTMSQLERRRFRVVGWRIENTSDDPITSCSVDFRDPMVQPAWPLRREGIVDVVRAGESAQGQLPCDIVVEVELFETNPTPHLLLEFTDAAGLRWIRDSDGRLRFDDFFPWEKART
jgi:hypothetical protein